jgi:hypothetical protein
MDLVTGDATLLFTLVASDLSEQNHPAQEFAVFIDERNTAQSEQRL